MKRQVESRREQALASLDGRKFVPAIVVLISEASQIHQIGYDPNREIAVTPYIPALLTGATGGGTLGWLLGRILYHRSMRGRDLMSDIQTHEAARRRWEMCVQNGALIGAMLGAATYAYSG